MPACVCLKSPPKRSLNLVYIQTASPAPFSKNPLSSQPYSKGSLSWKTIHCTAFCTPAAFVILQLPLAYECIYTYMHPSTSIRTKTIGGNTFEQSLSHERIILRKSFGLGKEEKRKEKKRKKGEALLTTATMSNARLLSNRHRRDYGHSLARIAPRRDFFNLVQLGNAYVFVVRRRRISLTVTDVSFSTSKPRRWDPRRIWTLRSPLPSKITGA